MTISPTYRKKKYHILICKPCLAIYFSPNRCICHHFSLQSVARCTACWRISFCGSPFSAPPADPPFLSADRISNISFSLSLSEDWRKRILFYFFKHATSQSRLLQKFFVSPPPLPQSGPPLVGCWMRARMKGSPSPRSKMIEYFSIAVPDSLFSLSGPCSPTLGFPPRSLH